MSALAVRRAERGSAQEFAFDARDHAAISALVYAEAGILLPQEKSELVYGRLAKRVRACELDSFADYVALIGEDMAERGLAVDALTTNHTKFFREDHHFDHFRAEVWPALARRMETKGRVRLWSAACSSGEEPYTLAMSILGTEQSAAQRLAKRDFRILATDLSLTILAAARAGRYPAAVADGVPAPLRETWMRRRGDTVEVHPELRQLIAFRALNLLKSWPLREPFDAIFCRNVMIYFDEPTKERLQTRLADQLAPGGFLYIGHSERLVGAVAARFQCVGRTTFRKTGA